MDLAIRNSIMVTHWNVLSKYGTDHLKELGDSFWNNKVPILRNLMMQGSNRRSILHLCEVDMSTMPEIIKLANIQNRNVQVYYTHSNSHARMKGNLVITNNMAQVFQDRIQSIKVTLQTKGLNLSTKVLLWFKSLFSKKNKNVREIVNIVNNAVAIKDSNMVCSKVSRGLNMYFGHFPQVKEGELVKEYYWYCVCKNIHANSILTGDFNLTTTDPIFEKILNQDWSIEVVESYKILNKFRKNEPVHSNFTKLHVNGTITNRDDTGFMGKIDHIIGSFTTTMNVLSENTFPTDMQDVNYPTVSFPSDHSWIQVVIEQPNYQHTRQNFLAPDEQE